MKEELSKSGHFWLPTSPSHTVPGTLVITDGGRVELEIVGNLEPPEAFIDAFNNSRQPERINGEIESFGHVTLLGCFYRNRNHNFFGQISKSRIHANKAILGASYGEDEPLLFNTLQFSVEGLNEWVGINGFSSTIEPDSNTISLSYTLPANISFELSDGIKLDIGFAANTPSYPILQSATIEQRTYFKLSSQNPLELDELLNMAFQLTTFVGFGLDATVSLGSVTATSDDLVRELGEGKTIPHKLEIIYQSLPFAKEPPKIEWFNMLFGFGAVREQFADVLKNWFSAYENIGPALNLYFSVTNGDQKFLENQFLALAQCLETYHRRTSHERLMAEEVFSSLLETIMQGCPEEHKEWLTGRLQFGNELSLSKRINKIIAPFKQLLGNSNDRSSLIWSIVNTRNYLTHYNRDLEEKAVTGKELWRLCKKMEAIFQLHLLDVIGFSRDEIVSIHSNSNDLRAKLKGY
jgi:hypothetical protein